MGLALTSQAVALAPRPPAPPAAAAQLWRDGDAEGALALLHEQAALDPLARSEQAVLLFEQGAYEQAAQLWQAELLPLSAVAAASSDPRWLLLARARAALADWPAVDAALSRAEPLSASAQAALLRAEAAQALRPEAAAGAWDQALALPLAVQGPEAALLNFKAALWDERQGRAEQAEARYKAALKLDPAYSSVHRRLGLLYRSQGRFADAKIRLERARRVDEKDAEASESLSGLLREQPALALKASQQEAAGLLKRLGQEPPTLSPLVLKDGESTLRVGLLTVAPSFKLRSGGPLAVSAGGQSGLTLSAGAYEVALDAQGWGLWALDDAGKRRPERALGFSSAVTLTPLVADRSVTIFDVGFGAGYFWAQAAEDRAYRGQLELRPQGAKGVTVVNVLGLEAWLLGVVPAEIWPHWPQQALRAQAIAARTDGLRKLRRHAKEGFDVCPSVHCAMYRGVTGEDARTTRAVQASAGQVLQLKSGRLAPTFYMNTCGGHTADAAAVWSETSTGEPEAAALDAPHRSAARAIFPLGPTGLLGWLDDPALYAGAYCASARGGSASYRWVMRYGAEELSGYVARRQDIGELQALQPLHRTPEGLVTQLRLVGSKGSVVERGDRVRSALRGIKSNLFYVETRRDAEGKPLEHLVHGGGWGHGVGFCQSGAAGMADAGEDAESILKHYFATARVARRW